ncbi:hypothetical protein CRG98_008690 [Punica granatum]|uniref:G-patch domain-containing protein n=1 Tax=Punica granatum TaxID=22663 RepID=A0A2I0KR67_PUNGR|nr:hypothetical protein CRG98_008690 [Punica granatum]
MEGPTSKGEESSKKASTTTMSSTGRRGKEVTVNAVNPAHLAPRQYSMNFTSAPPVAPSYAPHAPQYRPQPPTQPIYYSALPPPPPPTVPSPVVHHYAPTPPQAPQYQPSTPRVSQPTQQVPPLQGQQGGAAQPRPRRQCPSLLVPPSHIYRQIRDKIGTIAPGRKRAGCPSPFVIEYVPAEAAVGFTGIDAPLTPFVIDVPAREPYPDDKVPWTYEGSVGSLEQQLGVMGITRLGWVYENPAVMDKGKAPAAETEVIPGVPRTPPKRVTEEEAEAFMKIIKMAKSPAHISLLALLLSSEPHREALLRVLTAAQVPKGTSPDRMEETINSIFSNTISFSDDELPSEGCAHSRALHIVCKCNNHIVGRVMIDNGSALNVCPVTTLKQMSIDLNRVRPSKRAVRAFNGSRREEDYAIYKETAVSYISVENDENLPFHSFETISVIRDYGEVGPSCADRMIGKVLLRHNYIPGTGLGARGQGISRPIEVEEYKHRRGLGFRPSCHEIIEARRGNHLHRLATHYGRLNRGMQVPPLSHFFPRPPLIIGSTLDGPSSDPDNTPDASPTVCAVTEEISSGVHIRPAQENEELNNWTSVPRYSAVIADV